MDLHFFVIEVPLNLTKQYQKALKVSNLILTLNLKSDMSNLIVISLCKCPVRLVFCKELHRCSGLY